MTRFAPSTLDELREAVVAAVGAEEAIELVAGGSKRGLGRPLQTPHTLDLSGLSGIRGYEPNELVLTAAAATPLDEIEAALAEAGQMLAFEPPDWRALLGSEGTRPTLGGALACNLSGPRRIAAGAARDHFLGFRGVNGRGEIFKAGGRVVKNVTGYDLPKLIAGSYGTLAALEEVSVKVLPRPESTSTVLIGEVAPADVTACLVEALGGPYDVSAAAYLPAGAPSLPALAKHAGAKVIALRLEGPTPSVAARKDALLQQAVRQRDAAVLDERQSTNFWQAIGDAAPLAEMTDRTVWRVSVPPARGAALGAELSRALDAAWYLDWGGGLVWAAIPDCEDGGAAVVRRLIRSDDGRGTGHATLIRGAPALRRAVPVFEPQPPALAALSARIKHSFDPLGLFNAGRMVEGM